jgi:hypothetical protein
MTVFNLTTKLAAVIIAIGVMSGGDAQAGGRMTFIEGESGQICDNSLDLLAVGVQGIAPLVPPSVKPIMFVQCQ